MKRSFPPPAQEALGVLIGALVCGAACTPSHNVKAGAPQLIEFNIVQAAQPTLTGIGATTITPDKPECPAIATGASCLPMGHAADAADGGAFDADIPPDTLCRLASANTWCSCVAGMDPAVGTWNCDGFANVMAVVAVFDRLLDTAPLDPGDAGALTDVVTAMQGAGGTPIPMATDYASNGQANGLIFNLFGPAFFGNFRADGPSLMSAPAPVPAFPSGTTITVSLDAGKILAKDGTTPFEAGGLLMSRSVVFTTVPFTATVLPPDQMAMNPIAATVAFTNFVDAPGCFTDDDPMTMDMPCGAAAHVTVTANGAPTMVNVASSDGTTFSVTPKGGAWPAGATIAITVDAATQNLLGQMIDMAQTGSFPAP